MKEKRENLEWKFKQLFIKLKLRVGMAFRKLWDWICNNIETLIPLIPVVIVIIRTVGGLILRLTSDKKQEARLDREESLKNRYIYDRSAGFYWNVNKDLSQGERLAIDQRHRSGEPYSKILTDMKLL